MKRLTFEALSPTRREIDNVPSNAYRYRYAFLEGEGETNIGWDLSR
jgi:hypothetical protein